MIKSTFLKIVFPPFAGYRESAGLLLLRLLFGIGIALHGYGKLGNIAGFSEAVGVPYAMGALAVLAELVGGLLLAIGALTPLVGAILTGNMAVAVMMHMKWGDPFLLKPTGEGYTAGWEFAALYLFAFACLTLTGPGRLSVDYPLVTRLLGKKRV